MKSSHLHKTFSMLAIFLLFALPAAAQQVPAGFVATQVATGMVSVTRMEVLPDGRILVLEQFGRIRLIQNGVLQSTNYLNISVDSSGEHGLLGITLDPNFASNNFFYAYYTAPTPTIHNRVSRFTAGATSANPASEVMLYDLDTSVHELGWHQGGDIAFGPDGKMYIAVGDDRNGANSQSVTTTFGKILRINIDGSIPTDNPFFSTLSGKYRAIWAMGLRNPFSFDFAKADGKLLIGDVGEETWEEINRGQAGANYGWPETEGVTNDPRFVSPFLVYDHTFTNSSGCAVTAGAFYQPTTAQFPAKYNGLYFYTDFCVGWIRTLNPNTAATELFAQFTNSPVDLKVANNGTLYYLERGVDPNR